MILPLFIRSLSLSVRRWKMYLDRLVVVADDMQLNDGLVSVYCQRVSVKAK